MSQLCVYCRERPVDPEWGPFCSERCQLLDLANWVDGTYRVPVQEPVSPESDNPPDTNEALEARSSGVGTRGSKGSTE